MDVLIAFRDVVHDIQDDRKLRSFEGVIIIPTRFGIIAVILVRFPDWGSKGRRFTVFGLDWPNSAGRLICAGIKPDFICLLIRAGFTLGYESCRGQFVFDAKPKRLADESVRNVVRYPSLRPAGLAERS